MSSTFTVQVLFKFLPGVWLLYTAMYIQAWLAIPVSFCTTECVTSVVIETSPSFHPAVASHLSKSLEKICKAT